MICNPTCSLSILQVLVLWLSVQRAWLSPQQGEQHEGQVALLHFSRVAEQSVQAPQGACSELLLAGAKLVHLSPAELCCPHVQAPLRHLQNESES